LSFLQGFVSGAFGGLEKTLDLKQKVREAEAAEKVRGLFEETAQYGGLDKVPEDWFGRMASAVSETGDFKSALAISELGKKQKAAKLREDAYSAWSLLSTGDVETAIPIINRTLSSMGVNAPIQGAAVSQTGQGVDLVTGNGGRVSLDAISQTLERLMLSPEEAIKMMFERRKTDAYVGAQEASAFRDRAAAQSTLTQLPWLVGKLKSDIAENQASASASNALAEARRLEMQQSAQLFPFRMQETAAGAAEKELDAKYKEQTFGARVDQQEAETLQKQIEAARAANPGLDVDKINKRFNDVVGVIDNIISDPNASYPSTDSQTSLVKQYYRLLRPGLLTTAGALVVGTGGEVVAPTTAINILQLAENFIREIKEENPGSLKNDPEKAAKIAAQFFTDLNRKVFKEEMPDGTVKEYFIYHDNTDGKDYKVFVPSLPGIGGAGQ
jgi:hypothetical protein